jgi:hypothetical protein
VLSISRIDKDKRGRESEKWPKQSLFSPFHAKLVEASQRSRFQAAALRRQKGRQLGRFPHDSVHLLLVAAHQRRHLGSEEKDEKKEKERGDSAIRSAFV